MKSSQIAIPAVTGALGLALGLTLAPSVRKTEAAIVAESSAGTHAQHAQDTSPEEPGKPVVRTRARDRGADQKPKEPCVSIPLKSVVEILKEKDFNHFSKFDNLHYNMKQALVLLGATEREQEEIDALLKKSESEILAAEKTHLKLGKVTDHEIQIDMSGMSTFAEGVAEQTMDGIRTTLPADLAEGLISAINWDKFYPSDENSFTRLEVTRSMSGKLTAWHRHGSGGTGYNLDDEFKDDGTPIPAERVFIDRWKPFLKGVTILPKDEE